jgi:hypothetical protein
MSPFRWDVLLVGFVLAVPVFALGLRGDLTVDEVVIRLLWCLAAGWGAVAVLRLASTPRASTSPKKTQVRDNEATEHEPSPAI